MLEIETKQLTAASQLISDEKITFEDFLVKYDGQHAEWIDEKVILAMPATDRHQDLSDFLVSLLRIWVEMKDTAGVIRSSLLAMKLGKERRGREPDILFLSKKNFQAIKTDFFGWRG